MVQYRQCLNYKTNFLDRLPEERRNGADLHLKAVKGYDGEKYLGMAMKIEILPLI